MENQNKLHKLHRHSKPSIHSNKRDFHDICFTSTPIHGNVPGQLKFIEDQVSPISLRQNDLTKMLKSRIQKLEPLELPKNLRKANILSNVRKPLYPVLNQNDIGKQKLNNDDDVLIKEESVIILKDPEKSCKDVGSETQSHNITQKKSISFNILGKKIPCLQSIKNTPKLREGNRKSILKKSTFIVSEDEEDDSLFGATTHLKKHLILSGTEISSRISHTVITQEHSGIICGSKYRFIPDVEKVTNFENQAPGSIKENITQIEKMQSNNNVPDTEFAINDLKNKNRSLTKNQKNNNLCKKRKKMCLESNRSVNTCLVENEINGIQKVDENMNTNMLKVKENLKNRDSFNCKDVSMEEHTIPIKKVKRCNQDNGCIRNEAECLRQCTRKLKSKKINNKNKTCVDTVSETIEHVIAHYNIQNEINYNASISKLSLLKKNKGPTKIRTRMNLKKIKVNSNNEMPDCEESCNKEKEAALGKKDHDYVPTEAHFSSETNISKLIKPGVKKITRMVIKGKAIGGHILMKPGKKYENKSSNENIFVVERGSAQVTILQSKKDVNTHDFFFYSL
uniref:Uncharacterized protein n=1 Tax=Clastoptera arizonana TaxID=38151 RepID=A0A1B6BZL9_9HEMI